MRLLIAGSHGQVAKAFLDVAPSCPDITAFAAGRPALDICNSGTIERTFGDLSPDVVINTAAYTAVDDAEGEAERAKALNDHGARLLAEAAARRGVPIIHLSTDYVFNGDKLGAYLESDAPGPRTVYGQTKLDGERAVAAANPRHIILRTAWVVSPFGRNFVKTMLKHAASNPRLRVVADQRGNPTYAPHLVDAILAVARVATRAADAGTSPWGIYHAAGTGTATWHEVATAIFDASGKLGGPSADVEAITSADYPTRAVRPKNSELDCSKLAHTFGVMLPHWRTGIDECVARILAGHGA